MTVADRSPSAASAATLRRRRGWTEPSIVGVLVIPGSDATPRVTKRRIPGMTDLWFDERCPPVASSTDLVLFLTVRHVVKAPLRGSQLSIDPGRKKGLEASIAAVALLIEPDDSGSVTSGRRTSPRRSRVALLLRRAGVTLCSRKSRGSARRHSPIGRHSSRDEGRSKKTPDLSFVVPVVPAVDPAPVVAFLFCLPFYQSLPI